MPPDKLCKPRGYQREKPVDGLSKTGRRGCGKYRHAPVDKWIRRALPGCGQKVDNSPAGNSRQNERDRALGAPGPKMPPKRAITSASC